MKSPSVLCFAVSILYSQICVTAPTSTSSSTSPVSTSKPLQHTLDATSTYVGFVGDPDGRGTASLVISCVLTLILCVWSALHLNLPRQGESRFQSLLVNARWILAGVYAPELVVFTAWRQWSSAKLLGSLVEGLREGRALPNSSLKRPLFHADRDLNEVNVSAIDKDDRESQQMEEPALKSRQLLKVPALDTQSGDLVLSGDDLGASRMFSEHEILRCSSVLRTSQEKSQQKRCPTTDERSMSVTPVPSDVSTALALQDENLFKHPNEWTMTHNFFASTGGFAFEIETGSAHGPEKGLSRHFLPPECPRRLTLTARGMALLARCGRLPNIAEAEITDKSKANDLAKALVMIQASWMLVQVVARLIAKLPVTLLEVNTIAHVLCAMLMYAMWWDKPLGPKEPFVLKGDWVDPLCAYMYMSSEMSGAVDPKSMESQTPVKTLFAFLRLYSKVPELESMSYHRSDQPDYADTEEGPPTGRVLAPASEKCLLESRTKRLEKAAGTAFFERRPRVKGVQLSSDAITNICVNRWTLAAAAIEKYPIIREHYIFHSHGVEQCLHFRCEELLVPRVQNWPWDDLLRNVGGLVVGMVLWLACFVYGAVHMAAWNDHFPSPAEKWLWRSSSAYIGFCGGLWVILNYGAQAYRPLNAFWERWMDGGGRWWQNVLISVPVVVCGSSLILARAFIVVEAFVSIRELPAEAYDTPNWTQVFPHF